MAQQDLAIAVLGDVRSIPVEHTKLFRLVQVQLKAQQEVLQQHRCTAFLHPCSTWALHYTQSFSTAQASSLVNGSLVNGSLVNGAFVDCVSTNGISLNSSP